MTTIPEVPLTHTERARAVMAHIRGIKELIDGFTFDIEPDLRSLNAAKSVPDEFLEELAVAIEASEPLASVTQVQPAEIRDVTSFSVAFTPVLSDLALVFRAMQQLIAKKRASVCKRALQTYGHAKTFGRKTDRPVPIMHLEAMTKALGKGRPKSVAKEPAAQLKKAGGPNA